MNPSDEVQITLTREECARIHAALSALCVLQKVGAGQGITKALGLGPAVAVFERVLPRLAREFPSGDYHAGDGMPLTTEQDTGPVFDVAVSSLDNLTPQEAQAVFATEYDEAIRAMLGTLQHYTDYSNEDFQNLLDSTKALLEQTMPVPAGLMVSQSQPYVQTTDLVTLGALTHEMWKRQDQLEDMGKPF